MFKRLFQIFKEHFLIFIFLAFYFTIIAYKLIATPTPFFDWDEGINIQVAKEMLNQKSLIPLWQGVPWLDKPPFVFIFYASVMKLFPFVIPEISTRLATLIIAIITLIFTYLLYLKACKNKLFSTLTVVVTAFTPIFLQRSQIMNIDIFVLLGWVGYVLFVQNFYLSFIFLAISVLSKSLIGFYPAFIFVVHNLYLFTVKKLTKDKFKKVIVKVSLQIVILSAWYIAMLLIFGNSFWKQHIIESHFRRVAYSIESHFGKRTFYLDLFFEQLGLLTWASFLGLLLITWNYLKKKLSEKNLLYALTFVPWFIFLNLTKTKIFWYLYPAIPQFAFLSVYPLTILDKKRLLQYLIGIMLVIMIFYLNFVKINFFTTFYSKPEDYYRLTLIAKDQCNSLDVLVSRNTRETFATLDKMHLLITSSKQWGDHPSMVYYFGKKVNFYYSVEEFEKGISPSNNNCIMLNKDDLNIIPKEQKIIEIKNIGYYYLFKKD